ncbi:MAG: UMP kinase [Candidatus Micrarchaeota archaeon]
MQTICISLGGSVVSNENGLNVKYLHDMAELLSKPIFKNMRFIIVTGGGYTNRKYIEALREEGISEYVLDEIGIAFTKANAIAAKSFFKEVYPNVASSPSELKEAYASGSRIIFASGFMPGFTTDAVAIVSCEALECKRLINISKVGCIYNTDPSKKGAIKLKRISHDELIRLAEQFDTRQAKVNFVFDLVASKLAKRSKIRIDFIGSEIKELERALLGKEHNGTVVED